MTVPRKATWLDHLSFVMVLSFFVALGCVITGVTATLLGDDPGTGWAIAGGGAIGATGLFIVGVICVAIAGPEESTVARGFDEGQQAARVDRGDEPGPWLARGAEGVGGRAED